MTSHGESDSESAYSHDPLATDLEMTEDERETVRRTAMVSSDKVSSNITRHCARHMLVTSYYLLCNLFVE